MTYTYDSSGYDIHSNSWYAYTYEEHAKLRAAVEERAKLRAAAEERAKELLLTVLSLEQKAEFLKNRGFQTISPTGRKFEIKQGRSGNIVELDESGSPINRFCIHSQVSKTADIIPMHDELIIQKLLIESDFDFFLKTANRTAISPSREQPSVDGIYVPTQRLAGQPAAAPA